MHVHARQTLQSINI